MKVSTYLDYTNYTSWKSGGELITKYGGMLLPVSLDDNSVRMKNRGDVYLQFYCHIKSKYGLDEIRNHTLDYTEFIDRKKKLVYKVDVFKLTMFLNSILIDSTITYSTDNGYVQWFRKPTEIMVDEWIKKNILKSK